MTMLDPVQLEMLGGAIGDRLDFDTLDVILFKTTGDSKINDIAARADPAKIVARKCLQQAQLDGLLLVFLAFVVEARTADATLRDLILLTVPDAGRTRPTARQAKDATVAQLYQTRAQMTEPAIRAAMAVWRDALARLGGDAAVLGVYKAFHDCLHKLQVRRFENFLDAARTMAADPASAGSLREFLDRLAPSHIEAVALLNRLPPGDVTRAIQSVWITTLGAAVTELETGLNTDQPMLVKVALYKVGRILESDPSQINRVIFAVARELPLQTLVTALEQVSAAAGEADPALAAGAMAVRDLRAILIGKVVDHTLWQTADDALWPINKLFLLPPEHFLEDFGQLWPEAKQKYEILVGMYAQEPWARQVRDYAGLVDDALAVLESSLPVGGDVAVAPPLAPAAPPLAPAAQPSPQVLIAKVRERFDNYKQAVRLQFFARDKALQSDCADLLDIREPLQAILDQLVQQDG